MPLTTNDALLEAWAEQSETMEQNLESLYGPPGITPALPDITTEDGLLEAAADEAGKSAWNFAKLYSATTVVASDAYTVTVPSTALYCGGLIKVGGKTVVEDGTLLSAEVTKIVSKDSNGDVIDVYEIPEEVQALEGYGWSAGSAYNYIDFTNKKFVQKVGKVVLDENQVIGSTNWQSNASSVAWLYRYDVTNHAPASGNSVVGNLISPYGLSVPWNTVISNTVDSIAFRTGTTYGMAMRSTDTTLTTSSAINAHMSANPATVYYELATPVETDISAYLTETTIKVVPGGTLTFVNEREMDVPSELEYIAV